MTMSDRFEFTEAFIHEKDCYEQILDVCSESRLGLSEDTCWYLLEQCLSRLPIKKSYELLDELYGSNQIKFPEGSEFVVESIRARSVNEGVVYYFVKWEGWPPIFNTWEPERNLEECDDAIKQFFEQCGSSVGMLPPDPQPDKKDQIAEIVDRLKEGLPCSSIKLEELISKFSKLLPPRTSVLRPYKQPQYLNLERTTCAESQSSSIQSVSMKRPTSETDFVPVACKRVRLSQKDKKHLQSALQLFQQKLNLVYFKEAPITVENCNDSEIPPVDFQPIPDYLAGPSVYLPSKAPIGCECTVSDCGEQDDSLADNPSEPPVPVEPCWMNRRRGCCAHRAGVLPPYNKYKRLVAPVGHPVYECNSVCPCSSACPFRVVQLGRQVPLCIFRTRDRGWGVKAMTSIAKGTFVAEYLGEILTFEEAEQRGLIYDKQTMTYLFDLDFEGDAHYTVDASQMGNISHFINHSCDPNLTVRCVFIECLNPKLPRIALYASRFIRKGEELTFDYNMTGAVNSGEELSRNQDEIDESLSEKQTDVVLTNPASNPAQKSPTHSTSTELTPPDSGSEAPRMKCLCRSANCRGYLVN